MPATHAESFVTRESGEKIGLSQSTSMNMTQADHRFLLERSNSMHVPAEFGSCEISDRRSTTEKLGDFVAAAARRAADPKGWKHYFEEEAQKAIGVGEGLNIAKEDTKKAVAGAYQAVADGRAWNALLHAPELLKPAAQVAGRAVDEMANDPNAVNKLAGSVAMSIVEASNTYTHLAPREKGKVIGQVMFNMVNPEGSTEGASVAMKTADNIATHVDAAVVSGIQKSINAIQDLTITSPETARQAKEMLFDYLRSLKLSPEELAFAGVPKGFFNDVQKLDDARKSEQFLAASRWDKADNWQGELSREIKSSKTEGHAFRGDNNPYSDVNGRGRRKSFINEEGDLVPADPRGMYKGRRVSIAEHMNGSKCWRAKEFSPYTSFGTKDGVIAKYGQHGIELNLKALRAAIASGNVQGIRIIEHEEVIQAIQNGYFRRSEKIFMRECAEKDREILVEGVIPKRFLKLRLKGTGGELK